MADHKIDQTTLDAWRIGAGLSAFLLCLTFSVVVFQEEDKAAMRRCLRSNAETVSYTHLTLPTILLV